MPRYTVFCKPLRHLRMVATAICASLVAAAPLPVAGQGAAGQSAAGQSAAGQGADSPVPQSARLEVSARLAENSPPLGDGVHWRVFRQSRGLVTRPGLVVEAQGGTQHFMLAQGQYTLHAAFGLARTIRRLSLAAGQDMRLDLVLDAGGIRLGAVFAGPGDTALQNGAGGQNGTQAQTNRPGAGPASVMTVPPDDVTFDIFLNDFDANGERIRIAQDLRPDTIVRLGAGIYHVVSRYGSVNAEASADVGVQPGKLTEARFSHNAAQVTLRLVSDGGGEAIANTFWSVLTPDGDTVAEFEGAVAQFALAAGPYQVFAQHDDAIYQKDIDVAAGRHGDVELIAGKLQPGSGR